MAQKFCTYCGANLEGNTKFCVKCGKPLHKVGQTEKTLRFNTDTVLLIAKIINFGAAVTVLVFASLFHLFELYTSDISGIAMFIVLSIGVGLSFSVVILHFFKKIKTIIVFLLICLAFMCEMNYMFFCATTSYIFNNELMSAIFSIVSSSLLLLLEIIYAITIIKATKSSMKMIAVISAALSLALCFECGFPKQFVVLDGGELVYYRNPEVVTVNSKMNGVDIKRISYRAFSGTNIKEITIGEGVVSIGYYAFSNCYSLTSVVIPNSVTSIGDNAFSNCSSLTSVVIPNSVTSIGDYAFRGCSSLTSITIPNSVTSIGYYAFEGCTSLESITTPLIGDFIPRTIKKVILSDKNTSIGDYAFEGYSSLTSITIPDSVTSIGDCAFDDCSSLTSIVIPDSVTSIGDYAFESCSSLTSVVIPDSVTSIGGHAFDGCTSLESITTPLIGSFIPETIKNLIWRGKNTSISDRAFYNCSSLTSIVIPDSVTSIGDYAFYNCSSLTSIVIPDSVTSIGDYAFESCSSLTSVVIPDSVTSIGDCAFDGCSSLTNVFYRGSSTDWSSIGLGTYNHYLTSATLYYYSETEPTESGNYWHYVDDIPTIWE